ncbi:ECF-type sigma factor [Aurantiacibacter atlanticus]|uniref:ECF-type sigma factor n=1 Tax=Aurantiacibacter atlanticus TaxID=1648404 RepID=A0A0H4VJW3_9SPHN|nr:sigma-70 family RNA polymerase sigma factor [Aurantiacibacter atlanticus]AKQ43289.2 ECF-type sigma factor [Aurantiacibacter atlanticus]MDF1834751.1 sigma-70 family RNA polymerase sigma factor [Alteraurantiacibacter sp. bin_em_oilr2.035]
MKRKEDQNMLGADTLDRLMAAAREGDRGAYRQFLTEASGRIRRMLARKIGADNELEDVLQECLIALHEKRHTLDPGRPVTPWMYAIANYKLIDQFRKRGRSRLVFDDDVDMDVAADSFAGMDIAALLGELPDTQAEAIRLTHIEGLTSREAGQRIGIGISATKLRVHRGMLRLKEIVQEQER